MQNIAKFVLKQFFDQPNTSNKSDRNEGRYRKMLYFKPTIFHFQ